MRGILFSRVMMRQDGGDEHAAITPGLSLADAEERLFFVLWPVFRLDMPAGIWEEVWQLKKKPSAIHRAMFHSI